MKYVVLALVCLLGVAMGEQSPVILWGAGTSSSIKPALHTVSQDEFAEILAPLLGDHMIVAFQEENLNNQDFQCVDSETAGSCFAHLKVVSPKTYYSSVQDPSTVLENTASDVEYNHVKSSGDLRDPISCAPGKVVFVDFANSETHAANLKAHDIAMQAISKHISCPTAYLYLAAPSTSDAAVSRVRRATAAAEGGYIFRATNQLLVFFTQLFLVENGAQQELIVSGMTVTTDNNNANVLSVTLTTNAKPLTFSVIQSGGYYNMSNVQYDGTAFFSNDVNAPTTFSFYCGNMTLPSKAALSTTQLLFNSFQMQAPFSASTPDTFVFGTSWNCVGFVTSGIVMGLFVVALFLIIIFTGICWMMDINTMDRFDDPKGKTITINAGE